MGRSHPECRGYCVRRGYRVVSQRLISSEDTGWGGKKTSSLVRRFAVKTILIELLLFFVVQVVWAPVPASAQKDMPEHRERKLIVGVVHDPPYLIKGADGEWSGLSVDAWRAVATDLKVAYEFKEMEMAALLRALQEKEIDVSIEVFYLLAAREEQIDFTIPLGSARLAIATLPDKIDHPWISAIKIFFSWGTLKILLTASIALIFLGFLFWFIERDYNPEQFGGGPVRGIGSGVYWVGSTLASGVCLGINLKSVAARILGLLWMLVCALALSALTASLASSLTANKILVETVPQETLRQMRLATVQGSAESTVLKATGARVLLYDSEEQALLAVVNKVADGYLYDNFTLRYYAENEYRGKISVYPTDLRRFSFSYGLPVDSPWRTKINVALLRLMEKNEWAFLLNRYGLGEDLEEIPSVRYGRRGR